jgi:hypothetical protein
MKTPVTIEVSVDVVPWDPSYVKDGAVSFQSEKEAAFFWFRRADFHSHCVISQNPHNQRWVLVSEVYYTKTKEEETAAFWKEGWDRQRDAYGQACWDQYYRGVRDAELNTVFDRDGFGEKVIQRLSEAMPKWHFANKQLKENK